MNFHKNIKIIAIFNFFTDFRFFAPIAVLYFQKVSGSFTLGMSVFSIIFISSALFEIPTGIFSDRLGRKNTVILGAFFNVLALTSFALANSYLLLIVGGIFEGIGRSLYSGNNEALLHDTLAETKQTDQYHNFLGKTSSMFQLSSAISALIGGLVASISFGLVMWASVIPQIICLISSFGLSEPRILSKKDGNIYNHLNIALKEFATNKKLRLLTIASIINRGVGEASFEFQAAFYNLIWPVWALGIARTISNFAGTISYYLSGKMINRYSEINLLLTESLIAPIVKAFAAVLITIFSPAIMASMSMLYGISSVSSGSLQQKEFTDAQRATMGSLISLGSSLLIAVSSFFLGILADRFGIVIALIVAQLVLLSNGSIYFRLLKNKI